jgi:hypothetical protein
MPTLVYRIPMVEPMLVVRTDPLARPVCPCSRSGVVASRDRITRSRLGEHRDRSRHAMDVRPGAPDRGCGLAPLATRLTTPPQGPTEFTGKAGQTSRYPTRTTPTIKIIAGCVGSPQSIGGFRLRTRLYDPDYDVV